MNQNDRLIKFGQSILWSMAMLKREITFIVTMINRMLQARSLHGHIMEKHTLTYNGQARFPCFFRSISKFRTRNKAPLYCANARNAGFVMTRCVNCSY